MPVGGHHLASVTVTLLVSVVVVVLAVLGYVVIVIAHRNNWTLVMRNRVLRIQMGG